MKAGRMLILLAALSLLTTSPMAMARGLMLKPSGPVTLQVYESKDCAECVPLNEQLELLRKQAGEDRLVIRHYVLEDPESRDAFLQNQVTALPEYNLMGPDNRLIVQMKGTIVPERLLWEVREALGDNPDLEAPAAFQNRLAELQGENTPIFLLFLNPDDPDEQRLTTMMIDAGTRNMASVPAVLTFDNRKPEVQAWMAQLGLSSANGPAYAMYSPSRTLYLQADGVKPWRLVADLHVYAKRFNSIYQTILAGMPSPPPGAEAIHPAVLTTPAPPASDGMSPPVPPIPGSSGFPGP